VEIAVVHAAAEEAALAGRQDWQVCQERWLATRASEVGSSDQYRV